MKSETGSDVRTTDRVCPEELSFESGRYHATAIGILVRLERACNPSFSQPDETKLQCFGGKLWPDGLTFGICADCNPYTLDRWNHHNVAIGGVLFACELERDAAASSSLSTAVLT